MEVKGEIIVNPIQKQSKNKKARYGTFSMLTALLVIGVLVAVNVVMGEIDIKFDITSSQMYSVGKQSKAFITQLDKDVTLYPLVVTGATDDSNRLLMEMLDQYKALSPHIQIEPKDPHIYPTFVNQYVDEGTRVPDNSLIVVSGNRFRVILNPELFRLTTTGELEIEARITNAIHYVTQAETPIAYELTGHGELLLFQGLMADTLTQANYALQSIDLQINETVPEDCAVLLLTTPTRDYSESEAEKIIAYLQNGGSALVLIDNKSIDTPNFDAILAAYYVQLGGHLVYEMDANRAAPNDPRRFYPLLTSHEINMRLVTSNVSPSVIDAQNLVLLPKLKSGTVVTELMTSSKRAFARNNPEATSPNKETDDLDGPFTLAVAITDDITRPDQKISTRLVVVGTQTILAYNTWIVSALDFLIDRAEVDMLYIPTKAYVIQPMNITEGGAQGAKIVALGILPGIVIIAGAVVWLRRRNL